MTFGGNLVSSRLPAARPGREGLMSGVRASLTARSGRFSRTRLVTCTATTGARPRAPGVEHEPPLTGTRPRAPGVEQEPPLTGTRPHALGVTGTRPRAPGVEQEPLLTGIRLRAPGVEQEPPQRGARRAADEDGWSPRVLPRSLNELNEVQVCEAQPPPSSRHTYRPGGSPSPLWVQGTGWGSLRP